MYSVTGPLRIAIVEMIGERPELIAEGCRERVGVVSVAGSSVARSFVAQGGARPRAVGCLVMMLQLMRHVWL